MKTVILSILLLSGAQIKANVFEIPGSTPVKTIYEQEQELDITIKDQSFIPNIMGYGCPLPAINIPSYIVSILGVKLSHRGGFMSQGFAMSIDDPNWRYCNGWPTAKKVFGEKFIVGAKIPVKFHIIRQLVKWEFNGETKTGVRETVRATVGINQVISSDTLPLQ